MTTAAFALALVLIVTGVALIYVPAALLTAGVLLAVVAVRLEAAS